MSKIGKPESSSSVVDCGVAAVPGATKSTLRRPRLALSFGWLRAGVGSYLSHVADFIYPPRCLVCGQDLGDEVDGDRRAQFCGTCFGELVFDDHPQCIRCGGPAEEVSPESVRCRHCRNDDFPFERAVALGLYRGSLRDAILRTKRLTGEPLARALGCVLAEEIAQFGFTGEIDAVVPVPARWGRRIRRGTSAATEIARPVARRLKAPLLSGLFRWRRNVREQSRLRPRQRRRNVVGALRCSSHYDIGGARILLIDDVMTTGATATAATKALIRAGAKSVFVGVIARGVGGT